MKTSGIMILKTSRGGQSGKIIWACSKGPSFETLFRTVTKCAGRIYHLSVIPGNKAKEITWCGHIEGKDQGRNV